MTRHLIAIACAAVWTLNATSAGATDLTDLLPESLAGFESKREPRLHSMTSGAERAMISYGGVPRSLRLWITDVGSMASETVRGFEDQAGTGELTRTAWQGDSIFTRQVKMGRDQLIDAFVPVDRLVLWFRLKDHSGGEVSVEDLKPALDALDLQAVRDYGEKSPSPRVLYDPFLQVEPQPPMDADTLAAFLPEKAGGLARGEVKQQVGGYGKKASAAVFAPYGEDALIAVIDQGGLPAGYFALLREGVRKGLFEESTLAGQPLFTRIAPGELPVDIEVPGALAVVGERFQVQVDIPGDALDPSMAREIAGDVDLQGLAALGERLVDRDAFRERFRTCEPADYIAAPAYNAGYRYEILGPAQDGCRVRGRYTRNPNSSLVGPTMTCTWDNSQPFDEVIEKLGTCEGELKQQLGE